MMPKQSKSPLQHVLAATSVSIRGLKAAWRGELAFRLEVLALLIFLPAAFWLGRSAVQRALLVFSLLAIPVVELVNSAIEAVVDRIGFEIHELSGRAKNMGSAAVMIVLVAAAAVWAFIAWERFGQ